jgi:hypothetical protein
VAGNPPLSWLSRKAVSPKVAAVHPELSVRDPLDTPPVDGSRPLSVMYLSLQVDPLAGGHLGPKPQILPIPTDLEVMPHPLTAQTDTQSTRLRNIPGRRVAALANLAEVPPNPGYRRPSSAELRWSGRQERAASAWCFQDTRVGCRNTYA